MVIKDRWALTCAHLIVLEIAKCIADHISACTFQCNEPQIVPPTHGRRIPCERMKIHIRASKRFCMEVPVGLFLEYIVTKVLSATVIVGRIAELLGSVRKPRSKYEDKIPNKEFLC
uniref:Uncharacterized protein n=1 Tax=Parascaris univalens TaxID=6257 RepID=A0A915B0U4_PARUN